MKVLIEIDDIDYEAIKHGKPISAKVMDALIHGTPLPEKWRIIADDKLEKMIVVRKNATNGDVIKALFPNADFEIGIRFAHITNIYSIGELHVPLDWWNAPYKAEREKV